MFDVFALQSKCSGVPCTLTYGPGPTQKRQSGKIISLGGRVLAIARICEMQRALRMLHILHLNPMYTRPANRVLCSSRSTLSTATWILETACSHVLMQRLRSSLPRTSCWRYCSNWWSARDIVSRSKHRRATVSGAFRAVSQKLFSFCELSRSCIDSNISPAPLATAPNISAIFAPDEDELDGKFE